MDGQDVKAADLLTHIEREMALLSPEERARYEKEISDATADMAWVPNPGPQTRAYFSEADQLLYGGRAGGGKTDLILALALQQHDRSLLLRRQNKEVHFLVERMTQIIGSQEGYNGQDKRWRMSNGKIIMFGGCQHEGDEVQYKGEPKDLICVQRGTQIVMGDGSRKAIEDIRVGDMVMTLEGQRRTKRLIPLRRDHAVQVTAYDDDGKVIGSQVHSCTHRLLTSDGWLSNEDSLVDASRLWIASLRDEDGIRHTYEHPYTGQTRLASVRTKAARFSVESVGIVDLFDIEVEEVNHYISDCGESYGFCNRNCFDEATEFLESQVVFVTTWLRSTKENQKKRVIFATNPPTTVDGEWVVRWFAPWLDDQHELFGKVGDGELLWCIRDGDKFLWFDKPGSYPATDGRMVPAVSRTFIRSGLKDNPELDRSGEYAATLANLPEALRRRYEQGEFGLNMSDDAWQVIPSDWVKAAMNRWTDKPPDGSQMTSIGVDVAIGGADRTVLACRYGDWFAPIIAVPGVDTRDGVAVAQLVFREMKNNPQVNIDIGGGYGGHALHHLRENEVSVLGFQGNEGTMGKDMTGQLTFLNRRAEAWWMLREALDPNSAHKIALPPSPTLRTQLCCARWLQKSKNVVQIESKDDMKARLNGRSPDHADAVVMAWYTRETRTRPRLHEMRNFTQSNMGHSSFKAMYRRGRQGNSQPSMPSKQGYWN
jgi:hypothetical protein